MRVPNGFTATCQCGVIIGAMDYTKTSQREAGRMLGQWLYAGCTVTPFFDGTHCIPVSRCKCGEEQPHDE